MNESHVQHVIELLKSAYIGKNEVLEQAKRTLEEYETNPEFVKYLIYILINDQVENPIRFMGAVFLKKALKSFLKLPEDVQIYTKQNLPTLLASTCGNDIKQQVSNCISTIVRIVATLESWPELVQTLFNMIESRDESILLSALHTLRFICEDSPQKLNCEALDFPLNHFIPRWIGLFQHVNSKIISSSLYCVQQYIIERPTAFLSNQMAFIQGLALLTSHSTPSVLELVCECFNMMVEFCTDAVGPNLASIIEFMKVQTCSKFENVAEMAAQFWSTACQMEDGDIVLNAIEPHLQDLVPMLLQAMIYSEERLIDLQVEDEADAHEADRPEEMCPNDIGDDDDYDDNQGQRDLRSIAANSLDQMAQAFPQKCLQIIQPELQTRLAPDQPDWLVVESALLALGCISKGCGDMMDESLLGVLQYVLQQVDSQRPLIRGICCWVLSRYRSWMYSRSFDEIMGPTLHKVIERMQDHNKQVQGSGCSALSYIVEDAPEVMIQPHLATITQTLLYCLKYYQARNRIILFDAIDILCSRFAQDLCNDDFKNAILPPIIEQWNKFEDGDRQLLPLLEMMCDVVECLGEHFCDCAMSVYTRCLKILQDCVVVERAASEDSSVERPDSRFLCATLDLMASVGTAMGDSFSALIGETNLVAAALESAQHPKHMVRHCACSLIGVIAEHAFGNLSPVLNEVVSVLLANIDSIYPSTASNAVWALGEIAVKMQSSVSAYAEAVQQKMFPLFLKDYLVVF
eukprot:TRINITY_DN7387_c0_g1_i4.p1 TRINITY_DN7387_c0_g1~~TRINITY_DN7387_c0_g1_i4.p1  ORF type:complete len:746 (+),score=148.19 TRINITY_DN7387_c0_g1_i4:52-2289(+)